MEDFDGLMKQAVSIKTGQMLQKRRKFESLPLFTKAGLYYLAKYSNVRNQGFYQRYAVSDHLKSRGNKLFKEEKVDQAAREYEQALSIFQFIINKNPNWKNEGIIDEDLEYINYLGDEEEETTLTKALKVALYNNLAACYLNLGDFSNSKSACDEVLSLDPNQAKALYRRAKALMSDINSGIEEFKNAQEDLKKALELSPEDSIILQTLNKVKSEIVKAKSSSQGFKGIFVDKNPKKPAETEEVKSKGNEPEKSTYGEEKHSTEEKKVGTDKEDEKKVNGEKIEIKKNESPSSVVNKGIQEQKIAKIENKNGAEKKPLSESNGTKEKNGESIVTGSDKEKKNTQKEIQELEKFLQERGGERLRFLEATGRLKEANELRENLKKAMAAKQRMEKVSTMDFEKPNPQLQEVADKFGLDLNDPDIKKELLKIQSEHLKEIRGWMNGENGGQNGEQKVQKKVKKVKTEGKTETTEEENFEDMNQVTEADRNSKSGKILNKVIFVVAILFFLVTIWSQSGRTPLNLPRRDAFKDI